MVAEPEVSKKMKGKIKNLRERAKIAVREENLGSKKTERGRKS